MKKQPFFLRIGSIAGAIVLAGVLLWLARPASPPAPVTLPSGERLILRGVSYGTNHVDPDFRSLRLLPQPWRARVGRWMGKQPRFGDRHTPQPRLVVWLETDSSGTIQRNVGASLWAVLADENGRVAGERKNLPFLAGPAGNATTFDFSVLPRRSRRMRVVFSTGMGEQAQVLGQFELANPVPVSTAEWPAEELPVTRRNGSLECTIERLITGIGRGNTVMFRPDGKEEHRFNVARPGEEVRSTMRLRLQENSPLTGKWFVGTLELADATGNRIASTSASSSAVGLALLSTWGPSLWPEETWEVRVMARRSENGVFAPNEILEWRNVALPAMGQKMLLAAMTNFAGLALRDLEFIRREPVAETSYSEEDLSLFSLKATGFTNDCFFDLVSTRDESGRVYRPVSRSDTSSADDKEIRFGFRDIPADAQRLTFNLAAHRGRSFTFRIKPELVQTNIAIAGD